MPGLRDYHSPLFNRTLPGTVREDTGPVDSPVEGVVKTAVDYLIDLCNLMRTHLTKFTWGHREGLPFIATGAGGVLVAGAATAVIATFAVPEGRKAVLKFVGWDCAPAAGINLVTWQLLISGSPTPYFNNIIFGWVNPATPQSFELELGPAAVITLQATNGNVGNVTLNGLLQGFVVMAEETVPGSM